MGGENAKKDAILFLENVFMTFFSKENNSDVRAKTPARIAFDMSTKAPKATSPLGEELYSM